jgi:hypothetical protein
MVAEEELEAVILPVSVQQHLWDLLAALRFGTEPCSRDQLMYKHEP